MKYMAMLMSTVDFGEILSLRTFYSAMKPALHPKATCSDINRQASTTLILKKKVCMCLHVACSNSTMSSEIEPSAYHLKNMELSIGSRKCSGSCLRRSCLCLCHPCPSCFCFCCPSCSCCHGCACRPLCPCHPCRPCLPRCS